MPILLLAIQALGSSGSASRKVNVVTDPTDLHAVFESSMYDFDLCEDGTWRAWLDGHVVASGAFSRSDLGSLAEEALRLEQSRVGLYVNDRYGAQ
jgi:hypothetical protein